MDEQAVKALTVAISDAVVKGVLQAFAEQKTEQTAQQATQQAAEQAAEQTAQGISQSLDKMANQTGDQAQTATGLSARTSDLQVEETHADAVIKHGSAYDSRNFSRNMKIDGDLFAASSYFGLHQLYRHAEDLHRAYMFRLDGTDFATGKAKGLIAIEPLKEG